MVNKLTEEQYKSTMASQMVDVTSTAEPALDIWPYVRLLERQGVVHPLVVQKELVELVYRSKDNTFDHVLLPTSKENRFIVIVVDLSSHSILGYYDLDLKKTYS